MVLIKSFRSILFFLPTVISVAGAVFVAPNQQPSVHEPDSSAQLRNLTWGQLNFIHTTDTHGWLPGHLLEPNFGADWGDLISFVSHMRDSADAKGVDLLVVDSGDRHDGNGLSDSTSPKALYTEKLFTSMDYDIVTIGNHELYQWESTLQEYYVVAPAFGEKYVVSNVDLMMNGKWTPLGNRFRRFETKNQKLKVIGMGFLFDFRGNNAHTRVITCEDAVKQDWFTEALSYQDTDVFVVASHIPVRFFPEMKVIIHAIRKVHPNVVIQFLGGHSHIRDFVVVDERSTALESGRFLETIGWVSVENIDTKSLESKVEFSRAYIDFNLHSLTHHSNSTIQDGTAASSELVQFHTPKGLDISNKITSLRKHLDLDHTYGCVPKSYLTSRAKFPGSDNLYTLLAESILPSLVGSAVPLERSLKHPRFIIINTGSIRFDLFKGPFTTDTAFIISPFLNNWQYLPDVPLSYAKKILPMLNKFSYILSSSEMDVKETIGRHELNYLKAPEQRAPFYHIPDEHEENGQQVVLSSKKLTPGYVTYDDYGCTGDDTVHDPWPFHVMPNAVQAEQHITSDNQNSDYTNNDDELLVDVVFYDFLLPYMMNVLPQVGYYNQTSLPYGGPSTVELLTSFVTKFWSSC